MSQREKKQKRILSVHIELFGCLVAETEKQTKQRGAAHWLCSRDSLRTLLRHEKHKRPCSQRFLDWLLLARSPAPTSKYFCRSPLLTL